MNIQLHFACNDDNGNHTGLAVAFEVMNTIYLEGDSISFTVQGNILSIAGLSFNIYQYNRYIGNIIWDCATLESQHVAAIINMLRVLGWTCTEAESVLFDKFHAGQDITAQEIEELQ